MPRPFYPRPTPPDEGIGWAMMAGAAVLAVLIVAGVVFWGAPAGPT